MRALHFLGDDLEDGEAEEEEDGGSSTQGSVRIRPNSDFLTRYVSGLEKVNEKTAGATAATASAAAATGAGNAKSSASRIRVKSVGIAAEGKWGFTEPTATIIELLLAQPRHWLSIGHVRPSSPHLPGCDLRRVHVLRL